METFQLSLYLFLFLSFLPFIAFSSTLPFPAVTGVDGEELKLGEPYYIFSTILPKQDGLCLVDTFKEPNEIVQCPFFYDTYRALLVTFSAANQTTEDTVVRESIPYRIEFSDAGKCSNGNFWYIKDGGNPLEDYVGIGPETLAVEFVIKKVFLGYNILYCILIQIPAVPICYGFGFIEEFGFRRLGFGLGVNEVQFFFSNVTTNSTTSL